jgi:hypothetical protein
MTYTKPELTLVADARAAIQSVDNSGNDGMQVKEQHQLETGQNTIFQPTSGAYEADE